MKTIQRKTAEVLPSVNPSGGNVTITSEQYREYKELQAKRDRSLISLQTQMRLQNAEALRLARAVANSMIGDSKLGAAIIDNKGAKEAYELAYEILAHE